MLDVGGGASPYFSIYEGKAEEKYVVVDLKESLPLNEKRYYPICRYS